MSVNCPSVLDSTRMTETDRHYLQTYTVHESHFVQIFLNLFEWNNLPDGIRQEYIERKLLMSGMCAFWKNPLNDKLVVLNCLGAGKTNIYGEFVRYIIFSEGCYGTRIINKTVDEDEIVLLRNDKNKNPFMPVIKYYCERLTDLDMTIDVNLENSKTPYIVRTSKNLLVSIKKIFMRKTKNEPVVYVSNSFDPQDSIVTLTPSEFLSDKLYTLKRNIESDFYTLLGLNNVQTEKKERLVSDEVNSNNQYIQSCVNIFLDERQKFCKEINEKFGTNISVKVREELITNEPSERQNDGRTTTDSKQ